MRKVVFVFLLFTILSFPFVVCANGVITKLPPPPDGVSSFVVGYMPDLDTYRLGSTDYNGNIYISSDNGTLVNSDGEKVYFGDRYKLVNGSWVHYTSSAYWITWFDDVDSIDSEEGKVIVFSSNDFYGTQGQLLASAASDDVLRNGVTLIGNQLSSSKLLLYIFSPFRQILPYIVTAIVFVIAFYKAWRWLRVQIQGI